MGRVTFRLPQHSDSIFNDFLKHRSSLSATSFSITM